jgi:hypothetical protein
MGMRTNQLTTITKAPSAKAVKASKSKWGDTFKPLWGRMFARAVAEGKPLATAYRELHPGCADSTAQVNGSLAASHPDVRGWIQSHLYGLPSMVRSLTPEAVATLHLLMTQSDNARVQLDAANSVLDRGGVPKSAELTIEARLSVSAALGDVIEGSVLDAEPFPSLPVLSTSPAIVVDTGAD